MVYNNNNKSNSPALFVCVCWCSAKKGDYKKHTELQYYYWPAQIEEYENMNKIAL